MTNDKQNVNPQVFHYPFDLYCIRHDVLNLFDHLLEFLKNSNQFLLYEFVLQFFRRLNDQTLDVGAHMKPESRLAPLTRSIPKMVITFQYVWIGMNEFNGWYIYPRWSRGLLCPMSHNRESPNHRSIYLYSISLIFFDFWLKNKPVGTWHKSVATWMYFVHRFGPCNLRN